MPAHCSRRCSVQTRPLSTPVLGDARDGVNDHFRMAAKAEECLQRLRCSDGLSTFVRASLRFGFAKAQWLGYCLAAPVVSKVRRIRGGRERP